MKKRRHVSGEQIYRAKVQAPTTPWGVIWLSLGGDIIVGAGAHAAYKARERSKCYGWPWPPREFQGAPT